MNKIFLFPLQNSILFKKVSLPFHIFEDRYRKMIKDAVRDQAPVAIVNYNPADAYGGEICVAGIPHILNTLPDGRMDIYITGSVKCRLLDFVSEDPYKIYTYRALQEDVILDDSYDLELESLQTYLLRWASQSLPDKMQRQSFATTLEDPEVLINYCALFLVTEYQVKRDVMVAGTLQDKIKILLRAIGPKEISLGPYMPALKF